MLAAQHNHDTSSADTNQAYAARTPLYVNVRRRPLPAGPDTAKGIQYRSRCAGNHSRPPHQAGHLGFGFRRRGNAGFACRPCVYGWSQPTL
jgi:hypothetical protein